MAGLQIHRVDDGGTIILRLEGRFDARTAAMVRQSLEELPGRQVVLDFSRVREFLDLAVPVLMRGMYERNIRLKGLAGHQERMFRYFGFPAPETSRREYYTPEDQLLVG